MIGDCATLLILHGDSSGIARVNQPTGYCISSMSEIMPIHIVCSITTYQRLLNDLLRRPFRIKLKSATCRTLCNCSTKISNTSLHLLAWNERL